jgi:hypothetical protein
MRPILLLILLTACTSTAAQDVSTTDVAVLPSTTSTTPTTSTTVVDGPIKTTSLRLVDPQTLDAVTPSIEVSGWPWGEPTVLPDGRFLFVSAESPEPTRLLLTSIDFETGVVNTGELDNSNTWIIGYSAALNRVALLRQDGGASRIDLVDPDQLAVVEQANFREVTDGWWPSQWAVFDEGRQVAFYTTPGIDEDHIHDPPQVWILDLENFDLGDPIAVEGVVHGLTKLPEDYIRNPEFPYGDAQPGVVFDAVDGRLFVAHADGTRVTVIDLMTGDTDVAPLEPRPSLWGQALSWLIPPAQAKGSEPSAHISAWLSPDRNLLYITGEADDAWRDSDARLHTTTDPLGLTVVDTDSLQVVRSLELPVSRGHSTSSAVVATGTSGHQIWCDEVCRPGNNEPEVEGDSEASGLYILDPSTLEIVEHQEPGVYFNYMYVFEDWLITERDGTEGWGYQSIDTRTMEVGPHRHFANDTALIVTEGGILEVDWPTPDW